MQAFVLDEHSADFENPAGIPFRYHCDQGHGLSGSVSREGRLMERRKLFKDLSDQPIVPRVPASSRSRLKKLTKVSSRPSLNALMAEIMFYFLQEKPDEKGLKLRIPRFTIRFKNSKPVRTGWMQCNGYLTAKIERLRTEEKILVLPAIFWSLATVEPKKEESSAYYGSRQKSHGEWKRDER